MTKRTLGGLIAGAGYWQGWCIDMDAESNAPEVMSLHAYLRDLQEFLYELRDGE